MRTALEGFAPSAASGGSPVMHSLEQSSQSQTPHGHPDDLVLDVIQRMTAAVSVR